MDKVDGSITSALRIVPAAEIHADAIAEEEASASGEKILSGDDGVQFELVGEDGEIVMRSNRETIDDSARQTLTMQEIEELKREGTNAGKDLIAKLMLSHTSLEEKTAFSLAKYKLLKTKKYLRQFTLLPLDVGNLTNWLIEDKDPGRIMEMREEMLALVGCWGNVHYSGPPIQDLPSPEGGKWLIVDEVGGLLVAGMAERMGILYPSEDQEDTGEDTVHATTEDLPQNGQQHQRHHVADAELESSYATSNTLTLLHANAQPNLSLLKYFGFSADAPVSSHPLTPHLKPVSWLQLLQPEGDITYSTPPPSATAEELASWKSGKRGTYYRKRRRYFKTKATVDETRAGNFDGLVIASNMDPVGILKATIPLLRGGAPVAIYSPTVEPLTHLADLYSTSRRTAFITSPPPSEVPLEQWAGNDDFPLNPTLLLGVSVQTSKVRRWQVLPGRTHPLMTGRGGAEGYVFTGQRVIPAEGKVEARGNFKKRKVEVESSDVKGPVGPVELLKAEEAGSTTLAEEGDIAPVLETEVVVS